MIFGPLNLLSFMNLTCPFVIVSSTVKEKNILPVLFGEIKKNLPEIIVEVKEVSGN